MAIGHVKLEGQSPVGSIVGVYNRDGKMIAKTTADDDGNWMIPYQSLPVGTHHLRAVVTNDTGRTICRSEECRIEVIELDECEIAAESIEPPDPLARERYCNLVFALSEGQYVDGATARQITEGAGMTLADLKKDLAVLAECEE